MEEPQFREKYSREELYQKIVAHENLQMKINDMMLKIRSQKESEESLAQLKEELQITEAQRDHIFNL